MKTAKNKPEKKMLETMYREDGLSTHKIGERLGFSQSAINKWMKEYNIPRRNLSKAGSNRWKGGQGRTTIRGYREIYVDGKLVKEHRMIWEKYNGEIPEGYVIHHKNGIKDDNRIENLELMKWGEHNSMESAKLWRDGRMKNQAKKLSTTRKRKFWNSKKKLG